jgi:hypothetical protein
MHGLPDDLVWLTGNIGQGRAQNLVTVDNRLQALRQSPHLKQTAETYGFYQVVGVLTEPQLLKQP